MTTAVERLWIETTDPGVFIHGQKRGSGPPLLLLHGNPLSHRSWDRIAPDLALDFTVVATDLRGYGESSKPRGLPDHSNYSFRRMAQDQVDVMKTLGFESFNVAGHDRGARTAHRMALDHPQRVNKVAFLDIIPTHALVQDMDAQLAVDLYHWWFMAQRYDFPEKLLTPHLEHYIRDKLMKQGPGKGGFTEEEIVEYVRLCTPENIHSVCEDYRATMSIDLQIDTIDFHNSRKVDCPSLILWGDKSHTAIHHDPRLEWSKYCTEIYDAVGLPCGHYPTEQAPRETYHRLRQFFEDNVVKTVIPGLVERDSRGSIGG